MAYTVTLKKCLRCGDYKPLPAFKSVIHHVCEHCSMKKAA